MNKISEIFDNAIKKKDFRNFKNDALKLIGNSCICDAKKKSVRKMIKKKIVLIAKIVIMLIIIIITIIKIIMIIMIMIIMIMII